MKVQFESGRLRLRVGHAELASLRAGGTLDTVLDWPGHPWHLHVTAGPACAVDARDGAITLTLPLADLDALACRLPSRDGLRYALESSGHTMDLRLEVDLHDGRARTR